MGHIGRINRWVMGHVLGHWVMGHACNGSDGSWVTVSEPWSTLLPTLGRKERLFCFLVCWGRCHILRVVRAAPATYCPESAAVRSSLHPRFHLHPGQLLFPVGILFTPQTHRVLAASAILSLLHLHSVALSLRGCLSAFHSANASVLQSSNFLLVSLLLICVPNFMFLAPLSSSVNSHKKTVRLNILDKVLYTTHQIRS